MIKSRRVTFSNTASPGSISGRVEIFNFSQDLKLRATEEVVFLTIFNVILS